MNVRVKGPARLFQVGRRNFLKLLASAAGGTLLNVARRQPAIIATDSTAQGIRAADVILSGLDFGHGSQQGTAAGPGGLTLATIASGSFTSAVMEAPLPFNAIVPQWRAQIPEGGSMSLFLRTAGDDDVWSDWFLLPRSDDWTLPEDPDDVGIMLTVSAADGTHTKFQYSIQLSGSLAGAPTLEELRFTCIDSSQGPTSSELMDMQRAMRFATRNSGGGYPKPMVVSRAIWCTANACHYSSGLSYRPVTHLIVHHTVTSNGSSDWAAVVRAIWYFHTFTRGWGDIGYNYLVDMTGVLYEGHLGGDDVVGTHAAGANAGSMALALIGTFTTANASPPGIVPPPAMLNAAADLLSWKADQKGINVYDSSYLPYVSWGLPHLMGHRDVYGTTSCPGDQAFDLLPWLRDEVARRIGFSSDYIYIDELSGAFTKNNANWHDGPYGCGFGGHSYFTWSTTNPALSSNSAQWALSVPQDGWYEVAVYAPYGNTSRGDTHGARYEVTHANGTDTKVVDQGANLGIWVSLGDFYFLQGKGGTLFLSDLTTTDDNLGLWFDAVRLLPRFTLPTVTATPLQPLTGQWATQRSIQFNWTLNNPAVIAELTVQVATDGGFGNIILAQQVSPSATSFNYDFGQDYQALHWRLAIKTIQNNFTYSAPVAFGIDTAPPSSAASQVLYSPFLDRYAILLSGSDAGSGVGSYDVDFQEQGGANWTSLAAGLPNPAVSFVAPDPGKVYWFRCRATDVAGNVEAQHASGDVSTVGARIVDHNMMLPLVVR